MIKAVVLVSMLLALPALAENKVADDNWAFLLSNPSLQKLYDHDIPYTFGVPFARKLVSGPTQNEFGPIQAVPATGANIWAETLTRRIEKYQSENKMAVDGKITPELITALKNKGPGDVPGMNTEEWGKYFDDRDTQDIENLPKLKDEVDAPKDRDLIVAIGAYQVGRISAQTMRRGKETTKYGQNLLKNMWKILFTGKNELDCEKKDPASHCSGRAVTPAYPESINKWFPVPNHFFNNICAPKPAYMKDGSRTCDVSTDPEKKESKECPENQVCTKAGPWSWCGIFVTTSVKYALGNAPSVRWTMQAVGGGVAGYPGGYKLTTQGSVPASDDTTTKPAADGASVSAADGASVSAVNPEMRGPMVLLQDLKQVRPGDHMQLAVANSHQDLAWCIEKDKIWTIDGNGWGQEIAFGAKPKDRNPGHFYGFYHTLPVPEGAPEQAPMDCAAEWVKVQNNVAKIAKILDRLAGRKSPYGDDTEVGKEEIKADSDASKASAELSNANKLAAEFKK